MVKNNIIIFEFNSLYQILFEIRDHFSFEINNYNIKNIEKANLRNSIILSKITHKDFFTEKMKLSKNKVIFLSEKEDKSNYLNDYINIIFPFDIKDLIEKINISLIKNKYSDQSNIKILDYILDLNSRIISKEDKKISLKLTEKEIDIILFLKNNKKPQKVSILQNIVWGYSSDLETHTVETHIYRLRKKISEKFNDENFILSNDEGYSIK